MLPKRVFIIHGYQSNPEEAWLPWLKAELIKRGYAVCLPAMPHPEHPVISEWIAFIGNLVGEPDGETFLVGHSIGCQGVLRYLETLGAAGKSVGKTVLVAGIFPVGMSPEQAKKETEGDAILEPWFIQGIDPVKVKKAVGKCTVVLSDDDPYIDVGKAVATFRVTLDPKIIVQHGHGHFNEDDQVTELPAALAALLMA